ncbi:amidase family protein [Luteimonas sp. RD2P54]|uniref:Amidase family protein n=1 Tax=Luteimonas endophytica TaxID=3042023 RepID=A0ABT6J7E9_9GAMM|nr:amidase family protein [Luteimonas endophytica]MDH5822664.1 amidase family protein [Luteimonas endophytica]
MPHERALALGRLDAHAQAACVRAGELAAAELVEAAIVRAQLLDPSLGALSHRAFAAARAAAAALPPDAPFAGVPWLAKDSLAMPGMPTRGGSRSVGDAAAAAAPEFARRLGAQGLVAIGKSAMPEFGLLPSTEPLSGPVTRNPWSPAHSPGGSSGGAAAAVAAGLVPLAHGSDGAGSIRMPAACCGVVGLKPGRGGVVRARAPHLLEDLLVGDGLLARSVRDAAWAFATCRPVPSAPISGPAARRLRIGVSTLGLGGVTPHPEVAQAVSRAAALCAGLGHSVEETRLPVHVGEAGEALRTLWSQLAADGVERTVARIGAAEATRTLEPWTQQLASWHRTHCDTGAVERAFAVLGTLPAAFAAFHRDWDVLLTPVVRTPPPPLGTLAPDRPFAALLEAVFDWMAYTPLQNLAGTPAISLPLAAGAGGLPLGVQFAADRGGEETLLALACELEAAAPWHGRWPPAATPKGAD